MSSAYHSLRQPASDWKSFQEIANMLQASESHQKMRVNDMYEHGPIFATAALTVAAITTATLAAEPSPPAHETEPSVYRPVTSDLMNAVIQPRHIKLWLAGKAENWEYAEYERHNIGGALARIATAIPTYKDQSTTDLIAAFATSQLAQLEVAIKARNQTAFVAAYEGLTAGCNQCHQATDHAMVVMRTPDSDPFPDQIFTVRAN